MDASVIFWLAAVIAFALIEAVTVNLVSVWFIAGALGALLSAALGASICLQVIVFFAVSILLLALLRPFAKKFLNPRTEKTNADRLIGQQAIVTQTVDNLRGTGEIRIGGVLWSAKSFDGSIIEEGSCIEILRLEGSKVYVGPAQVAASL